MPLLRGGQVVVAPPGDVDTDVLRRMITEHGVTALWLTAGLFRLVAQDAPDCLAGAREVWTGGMNADTIFRIDTKTGQSVGYLLPESTNIRRVTVDNSTTPVTFRVGNNHRGKIIKLEPLD